MKKKLNVPFCIILCLILVGCGRYSISEVEKQIYNFFGEEFTIETVSSYEIEDGDYILKMKADDCIFYVRSTYRSGEGGFHYNYIYTTILSSFYKKHRLDIEQLAIDNGLTIQFEDIDYSLVPYPSKEIFTVYADKSQLSDIKKFIDGVIAIDDINKLFTLLYGDGTFYDSDRRLIYDTTRINIYDGEELVGYSGVFYGYRKPEDALDLVYD